MVGFEKPGINNQENLLEVANPVKNEDLRSLNSDTVKAFIEACNTTRKELGKMIREEPTVTWSSFLNKPCTFKYAMIRVNAELLARINIYMNPRKYICMTSTIIKIMEGKIPFNLAYDGIAMSSINAADRAIAWYLRKVQNMMRATSLIFNRDNKEENKVLMTW